MSKQKATVPTPEQIEAWKKKYGSIFQLNVGDLSCILRKPTINDLSAANAVAINDTFAYSRVILISCWLTGDEEIKTNDDYFLTAHRRLGEMIEIKEGEIKKL